MAKSKTTLVKLCPCCKGLAEWVEVKTQDVKLWQLACDQCGLATNLDEKKKACLQHWNARASDDKAKTGWIITILFSLFGMITAFIVGLIIGSNIS